MRIIKKTKNIWLVNTAKKQLPHGGSAMQLRDVLVMYFLRRNKKMTHTQIDTIVCHWINRNLKMAQALNDSTTYCP